MSEGVIAPALVCCNCTKPTTDEKADEANFEIYQYLTVDPNGDRNVFCTDHPFIFEDDCKPYININPFPFCQSDHYEEAVKNLEEYARRKCMEAAEKGNAGESVVWGNRESDFRNIRVNLQNRKGSIKQYPCILQVLDRWFNTKEETVNQYFSWSSKIRENMCLIEETFQQVIRKAGKKLEDSQPDFIEKTLERFRRAYGAISPDFDNIIINGSSDSFSFDIEKIKREWNSAWNKETGNPFSGFETATKNMLNMIELLSDMICDELFFTDNQELVSKNMGKVRELLQSFHESISELDYDDPDFSMMLNRFGICLARLEFEVGFQDKGKNFAGNDSFLVCRCGGIIRIMYDGQDLKKGFDELSDNMIELLKWIEGDLHAIIMEKKGVWDCWQMGVSFIDAYNFVRYILLSSGYASGFDTYYHPVIDEKVIKGFGVKMDITIQSRSEMNKKVHHKSAVVNLTSSTIGVITFNMSTKIQIAVSAAMFAIDPNDDNYKGLLLSELGSSSDLIDNGISVLGTSILILKGFATALSDFFYQSTADYVGNIKIDLHIGTHDITYERDYDVTGMPLANEPNKDMEMRMESYAYIDPSRTALVTGERLALRKYDNTIRVNTTLAVDAGKVEKMKKKYKMDENGFYEE